MEPIANQEELNFNYEIFLPGQKLLTAGSGDFSDAAFVISDDDLNQSDIQDIKFDESITEINKWDYIVAAGSAVLASVLDILWVEDLSFEEGQAWGKEKADEIVKKIAKKNGYKGDSVDGAVKKLADLFKIPADELTDKFGGGKQHHLRDFTHHASLLGLCCSIASQFIGYGFGTDINGKFVWYKIPTDEAIGKNVSEKIFNGVVIWAYHMISDFDGSGSGGWGTGVPGPLLSFFKEVSVLPVIKDIKLKYKGDNVSLSVMISKFFNGTYFPHEKKEDIIRFDLRTEMGLFHQLSKQAVPVIANECIVRGFYAFRRLYLELKNNEISKISDLKKINPKSFLPFNNKTVIRMITVSSGTFMLIVTSEAAIRAAIKSKGDKAAFLTNFLLGVNYPGVVRFVFACKADAKYISEDMKKACQEFLEKHKNQNDSIIKDVPGIEYLTLSEAEIKILSSLERQKIIYDIQSTKSEKQAQRKCLWLHEWERIVTDTGDINKFFFTNEKEIFAQIESALGENDDNSWLFLVAMELSQFNPYTPFGTDNDKEYKGLKCSAKYEEEKFCTGQDVVTEDKFKKLLKSLTKSKSLLNNVTGKVLTGAAIAVGATAITGGLAWAFAPEIAVLIAGESVAGLYGAALTSASLAFVGGGSLAVGGLGIAGGTAIITGGGALLGIAGSGAATMSSVIMLSAKGKILDDCAKLMTFSKCVLIDELNNKEMVAAYHKHVDNGIEEISAEVERMENDLKNAEKEDAKSLKKAVKDSKDSIKYIRRCNEYLLELSSDKGRKKSGKHDET